MGCAWEGPLPGVGSDLRPAPGAGISLAPAEQSLAAWDPQVALLKISAPRPPSMYCRTDGSRPARGSSQWRISKRLRRRLTHGDHPRLRRLLVGYAPLVIHTTDTDS